MYLTFQYPYNAYYQSSAMSSAIGGLDIRLHTPWLRKWKRWHFILMASLSDYSSFLLKS